MIWIERAVCIPQVGTIFQQILGAFFTLVSLANFLHVHSAKHVWCVTPVKGERHIIVKSEHDELGDDHSIHIPDDQLRHPHFDVAQWYWVQQGILTGMSEAEAT